jgi:hypothetical protein
MPKYKFEGKRGVHQYFEAVSDLDLTCFFVLAIFVTPIQYPVPNLFKNPVSLSMI